MSRAAVVIAVGERAKPKHLAAHVVADNVSIAELIDYLRQKLPAYMVPAVWQKLQALPLSANGKVDHKRSSLRQRQGKSLLLRAKSGATSSAKSPR